MDVHAEPLKGISFHNPSPHRGPRPRMGGAILIGTVTMDNLRTKERACKCVPAVCGN